MTASTLQGLKPQTLVAERDFTFGLEPKEEPALAKPAEAEKPVEVKTTLLPVYSSTMLFEEKPGADMYSSPKLPLKSLLPRYLATSSSTEHL